MVVTSPLYSGDISDLITTKGKESNGTCINVLRGVTSEVQVGHG